MVLDVTLYLFDGSNLFHAGRFVDREELVDDLASFVAVRGSRGIVVFDGVGEDRAVGSLSVRFAPHADPLLERLAADARSQEAVLVVTSDAAVRQTSGQEVRTRSSAAFLAEARRRGAPRGCAEPARGSRRSGDTRAARATPARRELIDHVVSRPVTTGRVPGHRPPPHSSSITRKSLRVCVEFVPPRCHTHAGQ